MAPQLAQQIEDQPDLLTLKDRSVKDFTSEEDLMRALEQSSDVWEHGSTEEAAPKKPKRRSRELVRRESKRLLALKSYNILDTGKEVEFDVLTSDAAKKFGCPIAMVSFVDVGRVFCKSVHGLEIECIPRSSGFCSHVVAMGKSKTPSGDCFVVPDATKDDRFAANSLVTENEIRFYAGAKMTTPEGQTVGTFCIMDTKPRPDGLSLQDQSQLKSFAAEAVFQMIIRE